MRPLKIGAPFVCRIEATGGAFAPRFLG